MPLSGASRYSRGRPDSSTYPLPPRHSSASATTAGCRLQTQYLASVVASRWNARSVSSPAVARSTAPATRNASDSAASDSTARSASTLRINGFSISRAPKARRYRVWCAAGTSAARIPAAEPSAQSSRVIVTISMMVATPRPSGPTSQATVSSNSGSALALLRLPSLSFNRWIRNGLRVPSGSTRGTRKQDNPCGAWASTRNRSLIGALVNHLCPRRSQVPSAVGVAVVALVRTSEPPCFSVMPIPASSPRLPSGTRRPTSYTRLVSSGS